MNIDSPDEKFVIFVEHITNLGDFSTGKKSGGKGKSGASNSKATNTEKKVPEIVQVYFCRELLMGSQRNTMFTQYTLKKRKFLGPTSTVKIVYPTLSLNLLMV